MKCRLPSLAVACVLAACVARESDDEESVMVSRVDEAGSVVLSPEEVSALGVETEVLKRGTLTSSVLRYGKVVARPQEDALVVAPFNGRLIAPSLTLGAEVAPGDVLCEIEPLVDTASRAAIQSQRRELQGRLDGASAQVEARKKEVERVTKLVSSGLATEADLSRAQADLLSEQAQVGSLGRASTELARMTGGKIALKAPVRGTVVTLLSDAGALVQQGTVLVRIVQAGPRWIDLAVPPGDATGSGYRAHGFPALVPVTLLNRGAVIQPDGTRRDRLEAKPKDAASLPPGATVAVEVLHEMSGIVVPTLAVVRWGSDELAFVEIEPAKYAPRPVQLGPRAGAQVVVLSGLAPGEKVVTSGAAALLGELGAAAPAVRTEASQ